MQDLFSTANLGLSDIRAMVRAMVAVAESDGMHSAEFVLVRQFYEGCRADAAGLADFDAIIAQPLDLARLAEQVPSRAARQKLLASCLLMAFADGHFSTEEKEMIDAIATGLGLDGAACDEITEQIRDHLLQQLARVRDVSALAEVNRELRG